MRIGEMPLARRGDMDSGHSAKRRRAAISYQLVVEVPRPQRLAIGRLGTFGFPPGRYIYTGSARRNLDARIARHHRAEKVLRWHIDYLLAAPGVRIVAVRRSAQDECALNRVVRGRILAQGFGASDCRAGCGAHLKFVD
jgi:Uri superfamily endonuclease